MCYKMTDSQGYRSSSYLYSGDIVGEGSVINLFETYPTTAESFPDVAGQAVLQQQAIVVYLTEKLIINGHDYRPVCGLVLDYESDVPIFVILRAIFIWENKKFFIVEEVAVDYFDTHSGLYILNKTGILKVIRYETLFSKWPLSIHLLNDRSAVLNQYSHTCEYIAKD